MLSNKTTHFFQLSRGIYNRRMFASISTTLRLYLIPCNGNMWMSIRFFHRSIPTLKGKSDKKGKNKGNNDDDDSDESGGSKKSKGGQKSSNNYTLPTSAEVGESMDSKIKSLEDEFSRIRVGSPKVDMLNHIKVNGLKIREIAQITLKSPTKLTLNVFDPSLLPLVVEAIKIDSNNNINPSIDNNTVVVDIPKPSNELRDKLSKEVAKLAEKVKTEIRSIRKNALDKAKKVEHVSEDDIKRCNKEIETLTDKKLEKVIKLTKDKENNIMNE